jgi:hypothetical protein
MTSHRLLIVLLATLLAALPLSACGSDSGADADSDPQELLERTFGEDVEIESGVLAVTLEAAASGAESGSLEGSLAGPFQSRGEGELPLLDLSVGLNVDAGEASQNVDAGLTLAEGAGYVAVDGTAYEVDEATYSSFSDAYRQSFEAQRDEGEDGSAVLSQLGVDPSQWLSDVTNEGTVDIEGTETVHISGSADVAQIVADARRLAEAGGQAAGLPPGELENLQESVRDATVDVYTGADDNILRRLDLTLELDDSEGGGSLSLALSLGINEVNEDQDIEAPADARPLSELIPGGLGGLGGLGGGLPDGGASPAPDGGAGAGAPGGPDDEYLQCLQEAQGDADRINECAGLLR